MTLDYPLFEDYEKALVDNQEGEPFLDALITLATGLSVGDILKLSTPDFNAISSATSDACNNPASYFFQDAGKPIADKNNPPLLVPFGDFKSVQLEIPAVAASRMMEKLKNTESDPYKRSKYILRACSELEELDIKKLSMPDWNQLQIRINDFLNETSAFFQE